MSEWKTKYSVRHYIPRDLPDAMMREHAISNFAATLRRVLRTQEWVKIQKVQDSIATEAFGPSYHERMLCMSWILTTGEKIDETSLEAAQ